MNCSRRSEQGFALIAVIFLIVVIGLAITLMSTLAARNSQQNTQSLIMIRAQAAADSAVEYAIQRIFEADVCTNVSDATLPEFSGFIIDISCDSHQHNQIDEQITLFELSVISEYGNENDTDYVKYIRTLTVER